MGEASEKAPLLLLHGGPGSTHNYFEVLDSIADTGRQVISYDQIGCGNSYLDGHPELWTQKTWIDELIAIREHLHLDTLHILGQSWGAMQAIAYVIDRHPFQAKEALHRYIVTFEQKEKREALSSVPFLFGESINSFLQ